MQQQLEYTTVSQNLEDAIAFTSSVIVLAMKAGDTIGSSPGLDQAISCYVMATNCHESKTNKNG